MEILGKILGTPARVKIMRLFLLNRTKGFNVKDIVMRSRVSSLIVRREIKLLASTDFIRKRGRSWFFNPLFKYASEFEGLLISADTLDKEEIVSTFKRVGRIKLLIISGVFIQNKTSRVDLL